MDLLGTQHIFSIWETNELTAAALCLLSDEQPAGACMVWSSPQTCVGWAPFLKTVFSSSKKHEDSLILIVSPIIQKYVLFYLNIVE